MPTLRYGACVVEGSFGWKGRRASAGRAWCAGGAVLSVEHGTWEERRQQVTSGQCSSGPVGRCQMFLGGARPGQFAATRSA